MPPMKLASASKLAPMPVLPGTLSPQPLLASPALRTRAFRLAPLTTTVLPQLTPPVCLLMFSLMHLLGHHCRHGVSFTLAPSPTAEPPPTRPTLMATGWRTCLNTRLAPTRLSPIPAH